MKGFQVHKMTDKPSCNISNYKITLKVLQLFIIISIASIMNDTSISEVQLTCFFSTKILLTSCSKRVHFDGLVCSIEIIVKSENRSLAHLN